MGSYVKILAQVIDNGAKTKFETVMKAALFNDYVYLMLKHNHLQLYMHYNQ